MDNIIWPNRPVLIVDFGAQYAQLIARRVREAHVYSEIVRPMSAQELMDFNPAAIIFSGGPESVYAANSVDIDTEVYDLGIPILGICYGAQLIARDLNGVVGKTEKGEYGRTEIHLGSSSKLLGSVLEGDNVWMSHRDHIVSMPPDFRTVAQSDHSPVAAFENDQKLLYGVQFHPEVAHTDHGQEIIKSFLFKVAGCSRNWTSTSVIETAIDQVRSQVGEEKVLCALSGGVDSAVAAALVNRAVGSNLTCVFVDTGLMRQGEAEEVEAAFTRDFKTEFIHINAKDRFFSRLKGVRDPEEKRKIIGELFIRIFEEVANEKVDVKYLVQGTLYPDVVESGPGNASVIKSHHNVGGLPDDMNFELVEPLRRLFKDEVRIVGSELGLSDEIVFRQPFPGPGLAVRIVGEVTPERVGIVRAADAIVLDEIRRAGLERELWQAFAVLADVRSVGVMGDERTYAYPIILRAVTSDDAMTADFARLPYDLLEKIASRVISEVDGVNRVAYDITSKPPGTIEWE